MQAFPTVHFGILDVDALTPSAREALAEAVFDPVQPVLSASNSELLLVFRAAVGTHVKFCMSVCQEMEEIVTVTRVHVYGARLCDSL